jgi:glutathione synthase/RimK-type ligase-like ATP-grasp enzyme
MTVLVCTASTVADEGVDMVIDAIEARGGHAIRFETDRFPSESRLTIGWDRKDRLILSSDSGEFDLEQVSAAWIRGMDPAARLPVDIDPSHRGAARAESDSMILGLLECLDVFQLNAQESMRCAPYKPRQLQLAREAGLEIPRTLITNDPEAAREFAATCNEGVIAKLVDGSSVGVQVDERSAGIQAHDGSEPIYTSQLGSDDLERLDSLRLCPMIFQEAVPKAIELRITVVGTRVFVAALDSSTSASGAGDWRRDKNLVRGFRAFDDCPKEIVDRILKLLDRVGLDFATVDMIVTPDGRYVFLEFNIVSGFAFFEKATGFPVSGAIADLLLGLAPSRISGMIRRGTAA